MSAIEWLREPANMWRNICRDGDIRVYIDNLRAAILELDERVGEVEENYLPRAKAWKAEILPCKHCGATPRPTAEVCGGMIKFMKCPVCGTQGPRFVDSRKITKAWNELMS